MGSHYLGGNFTARSPQQVTAQPHESGRLRSSAGIVGLQVTVLDNGGNEQSEAHPPSAEHDSIHVAYGTFVGRKFVDGKYDSRCKNRIEIILDPVARRARNTPGLTAHNIMTAVSSNAFQYCLIVDSHILCGSPFAGIFPLQTLGTGTYVKKNWRRQIQERPSVHPGDRTAASERESNRATSRRCKCRAAQTNACLQRRICERISRDVAAEPRHWVPRASSQATLPTAQYRRR